MLPPPTHTVLEKDKRLKKRRRDESGDGRGGGGTRDDRGPMRSSVKIAISRAREKASHMVKPMHHTSPTRSAIDKRHSNSKIPSKEEGEKDLELAGRPRRTFMTPDGIVEEEDDDDGDRIFVNSRRKGRSRALKCCILVVSVSVIAILAAVNYRIYG